MRVALAEDGALFREGLLMLLKAAGHEIVACASGGDELVAMRHGRVHAIGAPGEVLTHTLVEEVFGMANQITTDPVSGKPMVTPIGRHHVR